MSDVHSKTTKDAAEALWTLLGKPEWKLRDIADVIQAAEERGRRRGVEELTDAKALLTEIRHELLRMDGGHGSIVELPASLRRASTVARLSNAIRALDAALAPRGSAPVCDCPLRIGDHHLATCATRKPRDSAPEPARMDTTHGPTCWCGKPSHHESGWCGGLACQGGAPRDSGKEG